ncbi:MPN103 family protein [Mycoplasmoides pneumoniae]|uniref:MPN103 family protein n=1 Tax=Mycoplasmoides pneumoniae TaxID=2104 RepID=UPI001375DC0D|nr:hypothetical protein [Mycoplasmoides pneumoniae]QHR14868.1 hypothetical protein FA935_00600 [Mycoplasmoides pneumoniae]
MKLSKFLIKLAMCYILIWFRHFLLSSIRIIGSTWTFWTAWFFGAFRNIWCIRIIGNRWLFRSFWSTGTLRSIFNTRILWFFRSLRFLFNYFNWWFWFILDLLKYFEPTFTLFLFGALDLKKKFNFIACKLPVLFFSNGKEFIFTHHFLNKARQQLISSKRPFVALLINELHK